MGAAAIPVFMIASAAVAAEQANRQNQAARRTRQSAEITATRKSEYLERRQAVLAQSIARKSDQQRLQVARQAVIERGARIAASAAKGTTAFSGTEMRSLLDLEGRRDALQATIAQNFNTDMTTLQSQTESGLIDNQASLRATLDQAAAMQRNPFLSVFAGAMGGLSTGISVYGATQGLATTGEPTDVQ
jgi:hypothetical protein